MPIPHLPEVRVALWEELEKAGGTGEARDIIEKLAQRFQLAQTEREQRDSTGNRTFDHRVHSAVAQSRLLAGWIEPVEVSGRSIWKLTSAYFEDNLAPVGEEREELQKRLKAAEDAFDKLKEFALKLIPKED